MKKQLITTCAAALLCGGLLSSGAMSQSLDYQMMSEMFGEAVTAGATGAPQRASDVPATMIIITRDEIGRFPEYDIPGVLRHFGGVDVTRYAVGDGQVSIRGAATGYTPRLLVLVNGREVYLDSYGYTAWSTLPVQLDEIQQIEIVKGPQSALYGFNAVAGVVNIITRNPMHGDYAQMRINSGTDEFSGGSFVAGRQLGERFAVRASYGSSEANEFAGFAPNTQGVDFAALSPTFSRETGSLEGRVQLSDGINLTAEATFTDVTTNELTSIYLSAYTLYELASYKADLEADTPWGFMTASAYRNETELLYSFGPLSSTLTTARLQDLFRIGSNDTIRLSAEYREANVTSFPDPTNGDFGYETTAFALMWNHKFSNAVDITLAGRFDSVSWSRDAEPNPAIYAFSRSDYDVSIEEFSYNAALVWRPESGGAVRFTAARGVQAPTMFDVGFTLPFSGIALTGDPNIDPSIVTNYEIAYDRAISPSTTLRAAVFHQETQDVKGGFGSFPDLFAPVPTFLFTNRGDTAVTGAEITLAGRPEGPWSWDVNYTYKSVEDDLTAFSTTTALNFEEASPEHILNGHLGWSEGRFTFDGYANYVSSVNMPMQASFGAATLEPIDAYFAFSLRGAIAINDHLELSLNAQNVNFGDGEVTNTNHQNEARYWLSLSAGF
jgi:outer membrane receptor for ferrienterochelin and colicins